jgi:hypothetical protein
MLSHSTPRGLGWDSAAKTVPPFHAWGLERWNGAAKTVPPFHALGFGTLERRGEGLSRPAPKVHARIDAHPWMQRRWRVVPAKLCGGEQK